MGYDDEHELMIEGEGERIVSATSVRGFSQFDTGPNFDLVPHPKFVPIIPLS